MDIDFNLDSDEIQKFLESKLEETKLINEKLEKRIREEEDDCQDTFRVNDPITVEKPWKKIINGKIVVGMEIRNNDSRKLEECNTILYWNSSQELNYTFLLITCEENTLKFSHNIRDNGYILLMLPIPKFLDQLCYNLNGMLSFKQNTFESLIQLPLVELNTQDLISNATNLTDVMDGDIKGLLALISSYKQYEFVVGFSSDFNCSLEYLMEIYYGMNVIQTHYKNKYYVAREIFSVFDSIVIEAYKIETKIFANIFCKNDEVLMSVLHYLHQKTKDIYLIPKSVYENAFLSSTELDDVQKAIRNEFRFVYGFTKSHEGKDVSKEDMLEFALKLAEHQYETDKTIMNAKETPD